MTSKHHRKLPIVKTGLSVVLVACLLFASHNVSTQQSATPDARQITLYVVNCVQCHARPDTGAPRVGIAEDWQDAASQGEDAMLINTVQGIRGMPPLGYCSACSEDDLRVIIRIMAGLSERQREQK